MFVIRMLDGEEIHVSGDDQLSVNPQTGVITVERAERHGEVTTHYSPMAWRSVTRRVKRTTMQTQIRTGEFATRS